MRTAVLVPLAWAGVALDEAATAPDMAPTVLANVLIAAFVVLILAFLIPEVTVTVRRLHDADNSGFGYLLGYIPVIGPFILLALVLCRGTKGSNRFGPDPRAMRNWPSTSGPDQETAWPGLAAPTTVAAHDRSPWAR
jgi:uncharacterized membrane protein YhaH (DUF805 family)